MFSATNRIHMKQSRETVSMPDRFVIKEVITNGDNEYNNGCFIICLLIFNLL
jgi:hypothetical protein